MDKKPRFLSALVEKLPFVNKPEEIVFKPNGELTLGVEIELQLIDPETLNLVSRANELLKETNSIKKIRPEFYLTMLEINTAKCSTVHEIERDLIESLDKLVISGKMLNLQFAATGCHPVSRYIEATVTPSPRYHELIDRNQWLTRRRTVYSLHVHLGMKSGDECIRFNNFFLNFLPHLLALSASSPFWQGEDTGLASCRPTIYEAMPTAGQPYQVRDWRGFEHLCMLLKKCNAIHSLKDLWWDMRPSPGYGTLELRVCDGLSTLTEALAVTAYIHLLAHWFRDNGSWIDHIPPPPRWIARENKWRVMRHGMEANLVTNALADTQPIRQEIRAWLKKLSSYAKQMGYVQHIETLEKIMIYGNSSVRQRAVFAATNSLKEVIKHNISEFENRQPIWPDVPG